MVAGRRNVGAIAPWLAGMAAIVSAVGCGRGGLPGAVPVQGRVTFGGGECPHSGSIFFVPAVEPPSGATGPRAGSGRFEQDGRFEVTSLAAGDGLVPGSYNARIVCELPSDDDDGPGRSFVPTGFVAPGLTVSVGSAPLTYDVDVPKIEPQPAARTKQ